MVKELKDMAIDEIPRFVAEKEYDGMYKKSNSEWAHIALKVLKQWAIAKVKELIMQSDLDAKKFKKSELEWNYEDVNITDYQDRKLSVIFWILCNFDLTEEDLK